MSFKFHLHSRFVIRNEEANFGIINKIYPIAFIYTVKKVGKFTEIIDVKIT